MVDGGMEKKTKKGGNAPQMVNSSFIASSDVFHIHDPPAENWLGHIFQPQIILRDVPNTQNGDDIIGKGENYSVRGTSAGTEEKLPHFLRKKIGFRSHGASLGVLSQSANGVIDAAIPPLSVLRRAIITPPFKGPLNVLLGGVGNIQLVHLRIRWDAVFFRETRGQTL